MKKILLFFALIGMVSGHTKANPINVAQAQAIAEQLMNQSPMAKARSSQAGQSLSLAYRSLSSAGESDYYAFNRGTDGGFIIVAGDDSVLPVLGYADSGTFDINEMPDNLRWWLEEYRREIQFARSMNLAPRQMPILDKSVKPLMKTLWDQGAPYNNYCPTFNGGNSRAVTGCVATAMAQIMKTHNWPPVGEGSVTYDCSVNGESPTTLTADFSQISFDWSHMRDNYSLGHSSDVQKDAVATLMSAVGISVEMMYGASSGAYSINAMKALRDHFRYDKGISFQLRDFMPLDEWEQMLRDELDAGRPIYYAGQSDRSGGHAFVFDGYNQNGYFHVNWGWGGRSDGYFACSALNPAASPAGFNSGQEAIIGIQPDRGGVSELQPLRGYMSEFFSNMRSARLGFEVPLAMNNYTFLGEGPLDAVDFAVLVLDAEGNEVLDTCHVTQEHVVKGFTYYFGDDEPISMVLPKELLPGQYRLQVVYSVDSMRTVIPFIRPADSAGYLMIDVSDEKLAQFNNVPSPTGRLELIKALEPNAATMPADDIHATALLKTVGGVYNGELTIHVLNAAHEIVAVAKGAVSLQHSGEQKALEFVATATASVGDTCYVALVNPEDDSYWSAPMAFVIGDWPVPQPAFVAPTEDFLMDFGVVNTGSTHVRTFTLQGENLAGSVSLSITGPQAARFRVSPATISSANAMKGTQVTVVYSAFVVGNHEAQLAITGGGVEDELVIPLYGSAFNRGDCDVDGSVDVSDVNLLINIILGLVANYEPQPNHDLNGDSKVDVADVNELINIILKMG
ncbi:MAG: C10 family peptidase [Muribaculaceae bacterium]|nr:C10 family peptidase [Muribaculaceae bacterium]